MRQLMISLDKNILKRDSRVAQRMIEYGKVNELFVIIPSKEKESFDLSQAVHVRSTGGSKLTQFFRLVQIGKRLIKNKNIQEITSQDPFFTGFIGWRLSKKFKINLEVQVHGDFFSGYYNKQRLAKFILKQAAVVRVVGERVKQSLVSFGISENKIIVRPIQNNINSIESYNSEINLHNKYPGYEKIFIVLGRLEPVKNILWLIDVFKEVVKRKNYLLLIVGRGSEEEKIKCAVGSNIKLENWTENPYEYLKTADCVLFPSLSEGYGLVPMEAAVIGTPVIMNSVGVANFELKSSDKVKILQINETEKWIQEILRM